MAALTRQPIVTIKLGALPIRLSGGDAPKRNMPPDSEEVAAWHPWIETSIELFDAGRRMFESNFPMQKRWCSYGVGVECVQALDAGASAEEKAALFAGAGRLWK